MNFLEALQKCYNGFKIHREGWNSVTYLIFEDGNILIAPSNKTRIYDPFFPDLLKNDWQIYEEKPKTYTFQEAIYKLHNNEIGAIKRKNIPNGRYIFINDTGTLTISNTKDEPFLTYIPSINDILAKDWIIEE